MKFNRLPFEGAYIIEAEPFRDDRGFFSRIFCKEELQSIGLNKDIVQINYSVNKIKATVRGMHYQNPPKAEIKMVCCIRGAIYDVIVDLRKESSTFLKWHGEKISEDNFKIMYVPEGFAHGYQTLGDNSELLYFHTENYSPGYEGAVHYNDPQIKIKWPLEISDISEKDQKHQFLSDDFEGICL